MRQRILSAAMALAIAVSLLTFASAAEVQRHEVPVTLTVVNTERKISVTVPAALPVSLVDGDVVTATNAAITNQAQTGSIRVTGVSVLPAEYAIGDYANFSGGRGTIALSLNGCPTRGEGPWRWRQMDSPRSRRAGALPSSMTPRWPRRSSLTPSLPQRWCSLLRLQSNQRRLL